MVSTATVDQLEAALVEHGRARRREFQIRARGRITRHERHTDGCHREQVRSGLIFDLRERACRARAGGQRGRGQRQGPRRRLLRRA